MFDIFHLQSFYLPGSVDVHDQQLEQWNLDTPPLYLWSRQDWTSEHKSIAHSRGHLLKEQEETLAKGENSGTAISNYLMEENHDCYNDFSNIMNECGGISRILDDIPEDNEDCAYKFENEGGGAKDDVDDDHSVNIFSDELERMLDEGMLEENQGKGELQMDDDLYMDMENLLKTVAQLEQSP